MEEKEKAKELYEKGLELADDCGSPYPKEHAKDIANLIADEIIKLMKEGAWWDVVDEWNAVKEEIKKFQE